MKKINQTTNDWSSIGILAHELGHHLSGHTLTVSKNYVEQQKKELEALLEKGDTDYIKWADTELVNSLGHCNKTQKLLYKIGGHTKWALNMKWSKD